MSNVHERTGIGWIERKIKFQIFIFLFMVIFRHFCSKNCQFSMNFHDNLRNRNRKNRKLFFHSFQHIAHLSWKWNQNWGWGGVYISFVGTQPKYFVSIRFRRFIFLRKTRFFFLKKKIVLKSSETYSQKYFWILRKKNEIFFHNINFFEKKNFLYTFFFVSKSSETYAKINLIVKSFLWGGGLQIII